MLEKCPEKFPEKRAVILENPIERPAERIKGTPKNLERYGIMVAITPKRKRWLRLATVTLAALMLVTTAFAVALHLSPADTATPLGIQRVDGNIVTNRNNYLDGSLVYQLPETVKDTDDLSIIVEVKEPSLLEQYPGASAGTFTEYAFSAEADAIRARIAGEKAALLADIDEAKIGYTEGAEYDAVMSGFEITIKAADFEALCKTIGDRANPIVGEVYEVEDTTPETTPAAPSSNGNQRVENTVNVYETGIFNSSSFKYDGTGTVVAVLDTGLDYYHSAFSLGNFTADRSKLGLTYSEVEQVLASNSMRAEGMQAGLTAADVYINDKIPFSFDYADGDSDVYPIASDHGTHVAGIIGGKDDTITGVAPNAQLVIMKTFSDIQSTARTAWIMSALDDCVVLGVDVINMSLGTDCGFSRERDKEAVWGVYDRIREAGISVVAAASNSFNSTYSSEKNGNLGLTSNPDSSTVGSPSTYKGSLSVASISGVKTPYLLYNNNIIYFLESVDRVSEDKNFYDDLLGDKQEMNIEYVTIPGVGRPADYTGFDVKGKIALVRRGDTTFEEKANTAQEMGAAGIIIYNNVSGDIKMNAGEATIAVASIRQDDGEMLAAAGKGTLVIKRSQAAGPFMSDFSSWGPTPDLQMKPEITAHGGMIYSAVPGQSYDYQSGTSMATPNMAGVVALLRQYVKTERSNIANDPVAVSALVNQLLMSTADIVYNTNGLPASVRKQGAGLANLSSAAATTAFIRTYDRKTGEVMDKSKIELGDDPQKSGVYTLKFGISNFGANALSYEVSALIMTEGVSDTKTNDGKTTVTEQGHVLDGARIKVAVPSGGTLSGSTVTVAAGQVAEVVVTITLSDADKQYLDTSFANGMYVEGFIKLKAVSGTSVNMSVPYLAFYGDWTQAPIFDLDFYATNKDELDDSIDLLDKTLPDAYATRPIGRVEQDYVSYLGSYYFQQAPDATKIAADRKYISISNQEGAVNSVEYVWAGLLRNNEKITITVTEDATGEVVYESVDTDVRKSFSNGTTIIPSNIDVKFSAIEQQLKNNTAYTVTLKGYLDYDRDGEATNLNNTFTFPVVTDFESPALTDCEFYTEYDKSAKKTRLFARMKVYDNHYAMCMQIGYIALEVDAETGEYESVVKTFDKYMTPVYSEFNSEATVIYELTDYIDEIREKSFNRVTGENENGNALTVVTYDYALNEAVYEIPLPDEFTDFYFEEDSLTLSPYEVYDLKPLVYPNTEWSELLEFTTSNPAVATVVNDKLIPVAPGTARIIARDPASKKQTSFTLTVRGEGDEGYVKYDKPVAENFRLTGYDVNKAFYFLSTEERDIGLTGDVQKFVGTNYSLKMFPSEAVTLQYRLDAYFPNDTKVVFESSNDSIVRVDERGRITAVAEGFASVAVKVMMDGQPTFFSASISIEVKDPYVNAGPTLTHYFGNGGLVHLPTDLAITEIGAYAFTNSHYIDKGPMDEISEDMPETTKVWYRGEGKEIEEIVIPEGVKTIGAFAFADMTGLKKITLPSTLERIDQGAFLGCTSLKTVVGLENVKFINQRAFENCGLVGTINLSKVVAVADYAFQGCSYLSGVTLSTETQSVGAYAFAGAKALKSVTIPAEKIKLGRYAFSGCTSLPSIKLNVAVVPAGTFDGCTSLASITLGKDVSVIGEYAFRGTALTSFTVDAGNTALKTVTGVPYLLNAAGDTLLVVAPGVTGTFSLADVKVTTIGTGAFSGNEKLTAVHMPQVTVVGAHAFSDCSALTTITLGRLTAIGDYGFAGTGIRTTPNLITVTSFGEYAFAGSKLTAVTIPAGFVVSANAFRECQSLTSVTIDDGAVIGTDAFRLDIDNNFKQDHNGESGTDRRFHYVLTSPLRTLTIGENVIIGDGAFYGASEIDTITLGKGATIGNMAFFNTASLKNIDLSGVISIGEKAFSGDMLNIFTDASFDTAYAAVDDEGNLLFTYHAAALTSVDLSSLTSLGEGAFAYCRDLQTVKLGRDMTIVPTYAFYECASLATINLDAVKTIGENAFSMAALTEIDLSAAETVGAEAFAYNKQLTSVIFSESPVVLEEECFAYCSALNKVKNLITVTYIGDYAFAHTALTSVNLRAATYIGTHAFLKDTPTDFEVILGTALTDLGDNPFAFCRLDAFKGYSFEEFNDQSYATEIFTYNISGTVKVIDGCLYRVVPAGLEFVTYAGDEKIVDVADGTVRISDLAFAGAPVTHVTTPYTLRSVGHKAFYACDKLHMLTFTSYTAPILEEAYDYELYYNMENIPATGAYNYYDADGNEVVLEGLGILPFYMWNVDATPQNVYYGANFVDYIGKTEGDLVLVRPVNGKQYDSFIMNQYFSTTVDGAAAADAITLAAIAAIDRIPETVALTDEALVIAAREAYNKIATDEQRGLVKNLEKLTAAEQRIQDLKALAGEGGSQETETAPPADGNTSVPSLTAMIMALVIVILAMLVLVFLILLLSKQRQLKRLRRASAEAAEGARADALTKGDATVDTKAAKGKKGKKGKKAAEDEQAAEATDAETTDAEDDGIIGLDEIPEESDEL